VVVVDIRNYFTVRNVELIEVNHEYVYYAEEKREEGHNNLFLLEYNLFTRRERIVANYSLDDPTFVQHIFSFPNSILLLLENGRGEVWAFRVEKCTGVETARARLNCIGSFAGCKALSERFVLLQMAGDEAHGALFHEYQRITGSPYVAYLFDLEQGRRYFVKNPLLSRLSWREIKLYQSEDATQVLLLDPYGDEEVKRRCYRDSRWISGPVSDNLWLCPLQELLTALQAGEEELPLRRVVGAGTNGMARYIGMDEGAVYFRAEHFPTGQVRICSFGKQDGVVRIHAELTDVGEAAVQYYYEEESAKGYRITQEEDQVRVEGVVNSNVDARYEKKLGNFVSCIENRYLIVRKVISDDNGQYDFEYSSIYDALKQTEESFECKCAVKGDTLVLY
jgi:hypothetical protein